MTVVVPTRGRRALLQRCLEALVELDPPEGGYEIVVVVDGGTADDVALPRVRHAPIRVISQEHAGPAAARNRGASASRARWLAFTDDDCAPVRRWLTALVEELQRDPSAIASGPIENGLVENRCAHVSHLLLDVASAHFARHRPDARFFASSNIALSRARFSELGGFDAAFPLAAAEDRDFCARAIRNGMELRHAPGAVVRHFHDLDLRGLLRQQRNYGSGAAILWSRAAERGDQRPHVQPGFYQSVAARALSHPRGTDRLASLLLVAAAQGAYLTGFVSRRLGM